MSYCELLNALEEGVVCLLSLPGIGKTTTARYLTIKMKREKEGKETKIISISPEEGKVRDENGLKHEIQVIFWRFLDKI